MEILDTIFTSIKYAVKDIIILPGDNLKPTFKYVAIIAICNVILASLHFPHIKDYRGSLAAVAILGLVILLGRKRKDVERPVDAIESDQEIEELGRVEDEIVAPPLDSIIQGLVYKQQTEDEEIEDILKFF